MRISQKTLTATQTTKSSPLSVINTVKAFPFPHHFTAVIKPHFAFRRAVNTQQRMAQIRHKHNADFYLLWSWLAGRHTHTHTVVYVFLFPPTEREIDGAG